MMKVVAVKVSGSEMRRWGLGGECRSRPRGRACVGGSLYLGYVNGMAFSGRPCGPPHLAHTRSPRAGPGLRDYVRRDLGGHGGHGGMEATGGDAFPSPPAGPRRVAGGTCCRAGPRQGT
jgi:hypothetical protein